MCLLDQTIADSLQHVAMLFEIAAILLIGKDYKIRMSDGKHALRTSELLPIFMTDQMPQRLKELKCAYVIGIIAVIMEAYQLLTQYSLYWCN